MAKVSVFSFQCGSHCTLLVPYGEYTLLSGLDHPSLVALFTIHNTMNKSSNTILFS